MSTGEHTQSRRDISYIVVRITSAALRSHNTLHNTRVFVFPPGVSEMLRTGPLDCSVQLERFVVTGTTSWIISLTTRPAVSRKDGLGAFIPDPWRKWTMGEFVRQVGVVLSIRKVRDRYTKDGPNRHILPVIFKQRFGL